MTTTQTEAHTLLMASGAECTYCGTVGRVTGDIVRRSTDDQPICWDCIAKSNK